MRLYTCYMDIPCKFGSNVSPYIEVHFIASWKHLPYFAVRVADKSFCSINIFKALLLALESETIASAKYVRAKEYINSFKAES